MRLRESVLPSPQQSPDSDCESTEPSKPRPSRTTGCYGKVLEVPLSQGAVMGMRPVSSFGSTSSMRLSKTNIRLRTGFIPSGNWWFCKGVWLLPLPTGDLHQLRAHVLGQVTRQLAIALQRVTSRHDLRAAGGQGEPSKSLKLSILCLTYAKPVPSLTTLGAAPAKLRFFKMFSSPGHWHCRSQGSKRSHTITR